MLLQADSGDGYRFCVYDLRIWRWSNLQPVTHSHSDCGKEIHGKLYNDLLLELRSVRFLAFSRAERFLLL